MLHMRVGKDVASLLCGLMVLADDFVAYAILAQPGAMFVVLDFSSFFCAQFDHALLVFLVLNLAACQIEGLDRVLILILLVFRRVIDDPALAPNTMLAWLQGQKRQCFIVII